MINSRFFKKYLLPGFVFQSVLIGGGYGTGRELVEFFLKPSGPLAGLLSMLFVSTLIWCVVCVITFELARSTRTYDYRNFMRGLLGRAWPVYEVCYLVNMPIVLAVIAAAAGAIMSESFGIPYGAGVAGMMALIGFLVFRGTSAVEKFLSVWSLVLYGIYFVFLVWSFSQFGDGITSNLASSEMQPGWIVSGIKYAGYNIGTLPGLLFGIRHIETRREAVTAGLLVGPIGIIPGVFFYLAMIGQYPEIVSQTVPANFLLGILGSRAFQLVFQIMLIGTLMETGTGLIHAFNERVAGVFKERKLEMPSWMRPAAAALLMLLAVLLSRVGLITLIEKGYGTITWGFLIVFVLPVLTIGLAKILRSAKSA